MKRIFSPREESPMQVAFFASGGPGNLGAAYDLQASSPELIKIGAVITDRLGIPALDLADEHKTPTISIDFSTRLQGLVDEERQTRSRITLHTEILERLRKLERKLGCEFDLAVLAYRRIIDGPLLAYFRDKMINQHPADLTIQDIDGSRLFVGMEGHTRMLRECSPCGARSTTFLVNEGIDTGEILCQGPWVGFDGDPHNDEAVALHEHLQKRLSDWPSLKVTLTEIAKGNLAISDESNEKNGVRNVYHNGMKLPFHGIQA